jgi:hypothetical protein
MAEDNGLEVDKIQLFGPLTNGMTCDIQQGLVDPHHL